MFNKIILQGNLTKTIELRYLPSGTAVADSSIAVNEKYKNKQGEMIESTMFIDVVFFGRTAEVLNQYCKSGSKVLLEGKLKFEQWVSQDGSKRSKHKMSVEKLVMLDSKPKDDHIPEASKTIEQPKTATMPEIDIDNEIPF